MEVENGRRSHRHGQAWDSDFIPLSQRDSRPLLWASIACLVIVGGIAYGIAGILTST